MTPSDQELSAALRFIDEHIASPEELELLIALVDTPARWWDAALVSHDLGITLGYARRMLERFAAANLLDIRVTGDVRYQFRAGTQELHNGAAAVAAAYRTNPTALIQRFARLTRRNVLDFADAFRFRRNGRS
jgi:hypothetical protein